MSKSTTEANESSGAANHVFLRGRLAGEPLTRELPSGDTLTTFRLTVPRPPKMVGRVRVDSIECTSTTARVRRAIERASEGDQLEVTGSLHRRFWRSPAGPASRYSVLAASVRVSRAS